MRKTLGTLVAAAMTASLTGCQTERREDIKPQTTTAAPAINTEKYDLQPHLSPEVRYENKEARQYMQLAAAREVAGQDTTTPMTHVDMFRLITRANDPSNDQAGVVYISLTEAERFYKGQ